MITCFVGIEIEIGDAAVEFNFKKMLTSFAYLFIRIIKNMKVFELIDFESFVVVAAAVIGLEIILISLYFLQLKTYRYKLKYPKARKHIKVKSHHEHKVYNFFAKQ